MPKSTDKKSKKSRANKYDEKLAVTGSFLDVVKAAAKNANKKSSKKTS
jgi:hypothetical protein